jgi:hypothetical protein
MRQLRNQTVQTQKPNPTNRQTHNRRQAPKNRTLFHIQHLPPMLEQKILTPSKEANPHFQPPTNTQAHTTTPKTTEYRTHHDTQHNITFLRLITFSAESYKEAKPNGKTPSA